MNLNNLSNTQAIDNHTCQQAQLVCRNNPAQRFYVDFIGQFTNNVILVSMPKTLNAPYLFARGKHIQCRIQKDNVVYLFNTQVLRVCQQPYLCLKA